MLPMRTYNSSADYSRGTHSFDVFDTTLTRTWFHPTDLFYATGCDLNRAGLYSPSPESWKRLRQTTEAKMRCLPGVEEVTLAEIFNQIGRELSWNEEQSEYAMRVELERELQAIRPIQHTIDTIRRVKSQEASCIYITDTYFNIDFLQQLLIRGGAPTDQMKIFSSSQFQATKRTGNLFERVLESEAIPAKRLWHLGDNKVSDVHSARDKTINAQLFTLQTPTRYERQLSRGSSDCRPLVCSAVAGASRATRLERSIPNLHEQVVWDIGANVAGPLLTAYVLWILIRANALGLKRLCFLARDGQILVRIAKTLVQWLGFDIQVQYLFASRQSLFAASISTDLRQASSWLLQNFKNKSLSGFLSRVDVTTNEISAELVQSGFSPEQFDRPLVENDREKLVALLSNSRVASIILSKSAARRSTVLEYLRQEGLTNGSFAIVDIGWHGRLQTALADIVKHSTDPYPPLTGFYFGLRSIPDARAGSFDVFVEDSSRINETILEAFCAADHGSVVGFSFAANGRVEPDLAQPLNLEALQWGLPLQQAAIESFARNLTQTLDGIELDPEELAAHLKRTSLKAFSMFTNRPSVTEAEAFGRLRHAEDQTHSNPVEIAEDLGIRSLFEVLLSKRPRTKLKTLWLEGCFVRTTNSAGLGIMLTRFFKLYVSAGNGIMRIAKARG
jgi:predicted HAD superfamily hydrolase